MLDKLEYLLSLATERHFGRAALRLGVTQPTLSAGIRQLEERLGATLVNRGARFQSLTPEGERVLLWGRRILDDVRTMQDELRQAKDGTAGRLRIAAIPTVLARLPALTMPFLRSHPGVTFEIVSRTGTEVLSDVRNFEADVGITYLTHEAVLGFDHHALFDERYCLLTSAGGPLSDQSLVTWSQVASVPLCLLDTTMQNRRILDENFSAVGLSVRTLLESNSMITLIAHVRAGEAATILPAETVEALGLDDAVRIVPIENTAPLRQVGLIIARREPKPFLPAAFYEFSRRSTAV